MPAQLPDRILVDGEFRHLYSNPLEQYWPTLRRRRPAFHSLYNCSRGYIATWEIRDNQLFLVAIDGTYERQSILFGNKSMPFTLDTLVPGGGSVKAIWFSGKIRVPDGKMMLYEHKGYGSRFEKEIIMTIDRGDLKKTVTMDCIKRTLILDPQIALI